MTGSLHRADYGIDAPNVIRNLTIGGAAALAVGASSLAGWLPRVLALPLGRTSLRFPLSQMLWPGVWLAGTAGWMYYSGRYAKIAERDVLLDRLEWRGDERVLDVGCGRGLILVGAARRVPHGAVAGIDIWQEEDLSGNRPDAPMKNAAAEGVAARVSVQTADMRRMPFADGVFDVVTSRAAIHNLYDQADRARTIAEIARVLKPGGRALIADIRHFDEYTRAFREHRCAEVQLLDSPIVSALYAVVTFGSLRPNTMIARKDAASA